MRKGLKMVTKRKRLAEVNALLQEFTEKVPQLIDVAERRGKEVERLAAELDDANASVLVISGENADLRLRLKVVEAANETLNVAFARNQQMLMDALERNAEEEEELRDLQTLLAELEARDDFDACDPTEVPFA